MRTNSLVIFAAGLLAATTFKWSELKTRRTLGDSYREAKTGRLHTSCYRAIAGLASLILIAVGIYLAVSGDRESRKTRLLVKMTSPDGYTPAA